MKKNILRLLERPTKSARGYGSPKRRSQTIRGILALLVVIFTATFAMAAPTLVNCDAGQSLNAAISHLAKNTPATVLVTGTCTEYVSINGFEGLTVRGMPGATLVQPATTPAGGLLVTLLRIDASRSVVIDGLNILSTASSVSAIGIGKNSIDVRLRNLTMVGGGAGIIIFEASQVSIARVTERNAGFASVGVFDASDVHIEDCLFEDLTNTSFHAGLIVGASHVTIHGTTIRNMQVGMTASGTGVIDVVDFNTYFPFGGKTDVVIENPTGNNFNGADLESGSSLNLSNAKLRITNAGQPFGGSTGGVLVNGSSTLNANGNLVVSGSQGQGVYVANDSHASLAGSQITGGHHGGLVAVNLSTIGIGLFAPPTQVSGNTMDLFCDSKSVISGAANISSATTVQCGNLLSGDTEPIP